MEKEKDGERYFAEEPEEAEIDRLFKVQVERLKVLESLRTEVEFQGIVLEDAPLAAAAVRVMPGGLFLL